MQNRNIDWKNIKKVYYHAGCPDGIAAAMILADAWQEDPTPEFYIPLSYEMDLYKNLPLEHGVIFLDICPESAEPWIAYDPIVLDHHVSRKEVVEALPHGLYGTNDKFCGAMLVGHALYGSDFEQHWELSHLYQFARTAMVRDTWKKDHILWQTSIEQSKGIVACGAKELISLCFKGQFQKALDMIRNVGRVSAAHLNHQLSIVAPKIPVVVVGSTRVAVFNSMENRDDIAEYMRTHRDMDLFVSWRIEQGSDGLIVRMSFRSKEHIDCNVMISKMKSICADLCRLDGGGHAQAAGAILYFRDEKVVESLPFLYVQGVVQAAVSDMALP